MALDTQRDGSKGSRKHTAMTSQQPKRQRHKGIGWIGEVFSESVNYHTMRESTLS